MSKVVLVHGLPGSGKTTISRIIAQRLGAVHVNADWARSTITSHLGFSPADRLKQARALGQTARMIFEQGPWVVVDFVSPTKETRYAFFDQFKNRDADVYSVWMNTIDKGRFEDTNKLYQKPGFGSFDYAVNGYQTEDELAVHAQAIVAKVTERALHRGFFIRYNTQSDGKIQHWRIIDEETGSERLVDDFEIRGHMTPGRTVERMVVKWNVRIVGLGEFKTYEEQGETRTRFVLQF